MAATAVISSSDGIPLDGPVQYAHMPDNIDDKLCPGCKLSAVSEEGGLVVAFGQSLFHVDCFKCAKCGNQVTADTNLLLLSDGSPICANCSYSCNICHQPILDEAIMTGDDAYHAHCFKCKICKNRIDELVFAKTSQGIYCMDCHNERMIKIRKHTQRKAERERERQAAQAAAYNELGVGGGKLGGSMSTSSRDRERRAKELGRDLGNASQTISSSRSTDFHSNRTPYVADAFEPQRSSSPALNSQQLSVTVAPPDDRSTSTRNHPTVFHPPPRTSSVDTSHLQRAPPVKNHSLPLMTEQPPTTIKRSESDTSEVLSLSVPSPSTNGGLSVTSRKDKRRSINPGLILNPLSAASSQSGPSSSSPTLSPMSASFMAQQQSNGRRSPTSPTHGNYGHDSPTSRAPSPLRDNFPAPIDSTRPSSGGSFHSAKSGHSSHSPVHSLNGDDRTMRLPLSSKPTHSSDFLEGRGSSPTLEVNGIRHVKSFDERPSSRGSTASGSSSRFAIRERPSAVSVSLHERPGSANRSRPPSRADVPHSVESATDEEEGGDESRGDGTRSRRDSGGSYSLIDAYGATESEDGREGHKRNESKASADSIPPALPPKEGKAAPPPPLPLVPTSITDTASLTHSFDTASRSPSTTSTMTPTTAANTTSASTAASLSQDHVSGDFSDSETAESESSPSSSSHFGDKEDNARTHAHATFIAPALPPIRFSLNAADFSDLFSSVDGGLGGSVSTLKNLEALASVAEKQELREKEKEKAELVKTREGGSEVPLTPPPSAASFQLNGGSEMDSISAASILGTPKSDYSTISTVVGSGSGSVPVSEDGHVIVSEKGLGRRPSAKGAKLDRAASSSRALRDKKAHAEAIVSLGLTSSNSFRSRATSETHQDAQRSSNSSSGVLQDSFLGTRITLSPSQDTTSADVVLQRLHEALTDAKERGAQQLKMDRGFIEAIVKAMEVRTAEYSELRGSLDGMKRASKQYIEGLTVAQTEYDRELKARRDAEAEVTRLRVLLSGQAARLTALSGDSRRQELRQQISKELHDNLNGLEQDLSKLKVERDMTLAEVEELSAATSKSSNTSEPAANLSRTLTKRLDNLKSQYQRELVPLTQQREALKREVMELKAARDVFLEETTVLNARNEELAQLSAQYSRRMAMAPPLPSVSETPSKVPVVNIETPRKSPPVPQQIQQQQQHMLQSSQQLAVSGSPAYSSVEDNADSRYAKVPKVEVETHTPSKGGKFMKWGSRAKEPSFPSTPDNKAGKGGHTEHNFQPLSLLRFTRCDHCGDKMWGSQLRCTGCSISVHTRCINQVNVMCSQQSTNGSGSSQEESQYLPPSMFGRDLIEQVRADAKGGSRKVPVIVEKCIEAVEALAMDYEGIYRKTGGSGQSRMITQLFERGDYDAFDLCDTDRFNDICSVTSVLKTYLRSLPIPLLTHDLHDHFMAAVAIKDVTMKDNTLVELVNKLPAEHYHTLRALMLHLHRISAKCEVNLMNARNLGVVFGPTLMRSRTLGAEFSDMAGKALSVEWFVEKAPQVFNNDAN